MLVRLMYLILARQLVPQEMNLGYIMPIHRKENRKLESGGPKGSKIKEDLRIREVKSVIWTL